jgi:hypothetical protein
MTVGGAKTRYFLLFLDLNPLSSGPLVGVAMDWQLWGSIQTGMYVLMSDVRFP